MTEMGSRHAGDLEGQLVAMREVTVKTVRVVVEPAHADSIAVQHTAWMLVNLLVRQIGVVERVIIDCPPQAALHPNVIPPIADEQRTLQTALLAAACAVGGAEVSDEGVADRILVVGPGGVRADGLRVFGHGWWGGFSWGGIESSSSSDLPFGPYLAACLAAGQVFTDARLGPERRWPRDDLFLSAWTLAAGPNRDDSGPAAVAARVVATLAGVGAVGSTWVHALWACPGLRGEVTLADPDEHGIETTNLNRYPLFGHASLGHRKASEAARLARSASIEWHPIDDGIETVPSEPEKMLVSAVDTDGARRVVQRRYPARLLGASTQDLRAELLRAGPPGVGACLQCDAREEHGESDDQLRARLTKEGPSPELAAAAGVSLEELEGWQKHGGCGQVEARVLGAVRAGAQEPERFAVGFVSVLAGTLLAAQTVKEVIGGAPALTDEVNRAVFQFFRPWARSNGVRPHARRPTCPACPPGTQATAIWRSRYDAYGPHR